MERKVRQKSLYAHYFFIFMASIFIVLAVVGFGQGYQFIYAQHIPIYWFEHVHGAILTTWLLVFLTQAIFAAKGNLKFHRRLGQFSVLLGVLVALQRYRCFSSHHSYNALALPHLREVTKCMR